MRKQSAFQFISLVILSGIIFFANIVFTNSAIADTYAPPGQTTTVSATVGSYYLSLSGYVAPYASVVLVSNDSALKSTVADANGFFSISNVIVNKGFSQFCLDAVDIKRLGESYTCLQIPAIMDNYSKNNIFLPPTLGVQRTEVNVGDSAVAWGYSMPGATVTVHSSDGRVFTATADNTGYYEVHMKMQQAGQFELFADATYHHVTSLKPDRTTSLIALSVAQQVAKVTENTTKKVWNFLTGSPWAIILLLLILLILLILVLRKLFPRLFPLIEEEGGEFIQHIPFIPHRLHHFWMRGVDF